MKLRTWLKMLPLTLALCALLSTSAASANHSSEAPAPDFIPLVFHFSDGDIRSAIKTDSIEVLFNPKEFTVSKSSSWKHHDVQSLDSPHLEFTSGEPYRLQMELFFDTFEERRDVRELTDKIEKLALVDGELHRPPTALVTWGTGLKFNAILESTSVRYTKFLPDGTPVRAVMNATFKEFSPAQEQLKGNPRH